ncbi:MAG: hypothetical protein HXN90_06430 [Prevotella pallens]|nr:hypothetical protein [Prevotella pallens]
MYTHNRTHISTSSHAHYRPPFRGYIHICGHDKSAPTAADGLLIMLLTPTKWVAKHPARRRGRFIVPVS